MKSSHPFIRNLVLSGLFSFVILSGCGVPEQIEATINNAVFELEQESYNLQVVLDETVEKLREECKIDF